MADGIDGVLARMRSLLRRLPEDDGVAAFTRMYLQVTELVDARVVEGYFDDAAFLVELDVVFAGLFLDAIAAARVPGAWAPLVAARRDGREPLQYALAGMNAHINHDLPLAVVETCRRRGTRPRQVRRDYDRVNAVLASVVEPVRHSYLPAVLVEAGRPVTPLANLASAWTVEGARDAAWVSAEALWALRRAPALADRYAGSLGRTVAMASRLLLTPLAR